MIKSMTGYGTGNATLGDTQVSVEIKAVNSKFLDAKLYSPPEFHGLEMEIKKHLRQSITRGRVEVFLNYDGDSIDLAGRCNLIREMTQKIAKLVPETVDAYREKLEERIGAIAPAELDQNRLNQEVCYFSDRCDVSEEITRLKSHIQQFLKFLESSDPVGRRLDFLLQEMNRETNTIGSKSSNAEISHIVVDVKGELEKLREQVQNVE